MCSSYSCCLWSLPLKMTSRGICQVTILWLPFIDDLGMSISPWDLLGTAGDSSSALLACVSLGLHLWGGEDTFLAMHPLPIGPCRVEEERDNSTILRYLRELSTLSEISDCGLPIGWLIPPLSGGMRDSARGQQCSQWTNPRGHNLRHSGPDWSQAVPVSGVGPSPQPPTTARIQLPQHLPPVHTAAQKGDRWAYWGFSFCLELSLGLFLVPGFLLSAQLVLYWCFDWLLMRLLNSSCYYTLIDGMFPVHFFSQLRAPTSPWESRRNQWMSCLSSHQDCGKSESPGLTECPPEPQIRRRQKPLPKLSSWASKLHFALCWELLWRPTLGWWLLSLVETEKENVTSA